MDGIKNIIFDLGGVILDIDFKKMEDAFVGIGIKNYKELFGLGHAASFFKDHEDGKISDDEFLEKLAGLAKHTNPESVKKAYNALLVKFPEERITYLKKLRSKYRLFLLSNTNGIHLTEFQDLFRRSFQNGSLDDLFEKTYYSHIEGMRKPDIKFYEFVMKENNLKPEETLFIDDAEVNVDAARKTGMKAIHLKPGETILDFENVLAKTQRLAH